MAKQKFKDQVAEELNGVVAKLSAKTKSGNTNRTLAAVFFWQEIADVAKKQFAATLAQAQSDDEDKGFLKSDDALRDLKPGEHIVFETDQFSFVVKVGDVPNIFDKEAFIARMAKMLKEPVKKIEKIAAKTVKSDGQKRLTKRILEA